MTSPAPVTRASQRNRRLSARTIFRSSPAPEAQSGRHCVTPRRPVDQRTWKARPPADLTRAAAGHTQAADVLSMPPGIERVPVHDGNLHAGRSACKAGSAAATWPVRQSAAGSGPGIRRAGTGNTLGGIQVTPWPGFRVIPPARYRVVRRWLRRAEPASFPADHCCAKLPSRLSFFRRGFVRPGNACPKDAAAAGGPCCRAAAARTGAAAGVLPGPGSPAASARAVPGTPASPGGARAYTRAGRRRVPRQSAPSSQLARPANIASPIGHRASPAAARARGPLSWPEPRRRRFTVLAHPSMAGPVYLAAAARRARSGDPGRLGAGAQEALADGDGYPAQPVPPVPPRRERGTGRSDTGRMGPGGGRRRVRAARRWAGLATPPGVG